MNEPLISIIIPTYNRAHLIGETLDSVIAQTYTNWECIVVDDGSTDNTNEVLKKYCEKDSRIQYHNRPEGHLSGGNGARNYGFKLSKGEYINWFDSDDLMHKDKLKLQIDILENNEKDCFNATNCFLFSNSIKNNLKLRSKKLESVDFFIDFLSQEIVFLTSSVVFRKSFLLSLVFRFNEKLKAAQEWEFFSKILTLSPKFSCLDKPLSFNRLHDNSISNMPNYIFERSYNYFLARQNVLSFIKKHRLYDTRSINCLTETIIEFFKFFLKRHKYKMAFKIYFKSILFTSLNFEHKVKLLFALISYVLVGRGETFLKNKNA